MSIGPMPKCYQCIHFKTEWNCDAFKKIPKEIILGYDHTNEYAGDHGIRFKRGQK